MRLCRRPVQHYSHTDGERCVPRATVIKAPMVGQHTFGQLSTGHLLLLFRWAAVYDAPQVGVGGRFQFVGLSFSEMSCTHTHNDQ